MDFHNVHRASNVNKCSSVVKRTTACYVLLFGKSEYRE